MSGAGEAPPPQTDPPPAAPETVGSGLTVTATPAETGLAQLDGATPNV